jgi:hypothetical protein
MPMARQREHPGGVTQKFQKLWKLLAILLMLIPFFSIDESAIPLSRTTA